MSAQPEGYTDEQDVRGQERSWHPNARQTIGVSGGLAVENFDWIIFGLMATYLGPNFFPSDSQVASTLSTLAVFGAGFAARPLGAALFGTVADRFGRRRVMMTTILLMGLSGIAMASLPSHAVIGLWASALLVTLRLVQGLSMGGETAFNGVYAVELPSKGKIGLFGGWLMSGVQVGNLIGTLTVFALVETLGDNGMTAWGWRIPFALSAFVALFVMWMRRTVPETLESDIVGRGETPPASAVWRRVRGQWQRVAVVVFVVGGVQIVNYGWTVGLPNLAINKFNEDDGAVFAVTTALIALLIIVSPIAGLMADRVRISRLYIWSRLAAIPAAFALLLYTQPGLLTFALVMMLGGVILAANLALYNVVAGTLIPMDCRTLGVGLGYQIAVLLLGGTAPYLIVWLGQFGNSMLMFASYASVAVVISVLLYIPARRRGLYAGN